MLLRYITKLMRKVPLGRGERGGGGMWNRVKRQQRTCEANQEGENSSFIFTVYIKSVLRYHFKLAFVVLHMTVKEFFGTHF